MFKKVIPATTLNLNPSFEKEIVQFEIRIIFYKEVLHHYFCIKFLNET